MKFDFKFFSVFFVVFVLFFSFFVILVNAGVLKTSISKGSGSIISVIWSQGCPNYNLGPDECSSTKPLYCPKNSKGTSSDKAINNCIKCGCPTDYECQSDGSCKKCSSPCSPNPCASNEKCVVVDLCAGDYKCESTDTGGGDSGEDSGGGSSDRNCYFSYCTGSYNGHCVRDSTHCPGLDSCKSDADCRG